MTKNALNQNTKFVQELLNTIENNFEHRCNGSLALHVLELIESTLKSAQC